jgi:hypothetical protein
MPFNLKKGCVKEFNLKGEITSHFSHLQIFRYVSFLSPYLFCLLTVGVEIVYFHLITHRHTPQTV